MGPANGYRWMARKLIVLFAMYPTAGMLRTRKSGSTNVNQIYIFMEKNAKNRDQGCIVWMYKWLRPWTVSRFIVSQTKMQSCENFFVGTYEQMRSLGIWLGLKLYLALRLLTETDVSVKPNRRQEPTYRRYMQYRNNEHQLTQCSSVQRTYR